MAASASVLAAGVVTCRRPVPAIGQSSALIAVIIGAVSPRARQRAIEASGDDTFRTGIYDIVRQQFQSRRTSAQ